MKIVTADEMKSLDERATSECLIPSLLLMENAARGLVDATEKHFFLVAGKSITIIAGRGNNGGDGLAAARHLRMRGAAVTIYLLAQKSALRGDAKVSLDIWLATNGRLFSGEDFDPEQMTCDLKKSDLTIDALFGTGLSRPLTGQDEKAISLVNQYAKTVASVDIPSGISADTGQILGTAIKACATMTMAFPKRGHFMRDGLSHSGKLSVVDIGIPESLIQKAKLQTALITFSKIQGLLPPREKGVHKGTMGHLLVIAGALGKQGAAQMCSLSALRAGAGLVTTALPETIEPGFLKTVEMMTLPLPASVSGGLALSAEKALLKAIEGKKVLAVGPGLSQDSEAQQLVLNLITNVSIPMVVDADGLNAIATNIAVLNQKKAALILTPHPGEMGRLVSLSAAEIEADRFNIASQFATKWGVILVLKGAHTIVATPDGAIWVNDTGNPGMATAGMGDALTGMIAAFLAQGLTPQNAALLGVYLHGRAGDLAKAARGEVGLITSDLIDKIPQSIVEYLDRSA